MRFRRYSCGTCLIAAILNGAGAIAGPAVSFVPGIDRLTIGPEAAPSTDPMLRVETGAHSARILSTAVDRSGTWLVTSAADKSARVWEVASGRLLRVLRPPVGAGIVGDISRVAMSPEGSLVAVAWRSSSSAAIYLFDRAAGEVDARIDGPVDVVTDLQFSPDGRSIAATVVKGGVQLFDVLSGQERGRDLAYERDAYSVDFSSDGQHLITSSIDGHIRSYAVAGGQLQKVADKSASSMLSRPLSARYSPDGHWIAVGYDLMGGVRILRADDLATATDVSARGINSNMPHIAWSRDGRFLYAVGINKDGETVVRRWPTKVNAVAVALGSPVNLLTSYTDLPVKGAGAILTTPSPLPDGGLVLATQQPAWGVLSADGAVEWRQVGAPTRHASYRGNGAAGPTLRLSPDARQVAFSFDYGAAASVASFDLGSREFSMPGPAQAPAQQTMPGLAVSSGGLRLNGRPLPLAPNEILTSFAVGASNQRLVVGTTLAVRVFDPQGQMIASLPTWADAVGVSSDGRWIVADLADGTIRWMRAADGQEVLALYPHPDRRRWVLWTPSGYYACSPGGEDLIGWQINRGPKAAADFFPASRFRKDFYRPDVVAKVLALGDEVQALRAANQESGRPAANAPQRLQSVLPPVVTVVSPADGAPVSTPQVMVKFAVRSAAGAPITAVRVRVNGHAVAVAAAAVVAGNSGQDLRQVVVPIPPQEADIEIFAENQNAVSTPGVVRVTWQGKAPVAPVAVKPKLYVLAVGVSRYENPDYRLQLAAKDATDFAQAMSAQKGLVYRDVEAQVLTDAKANTAGVLAGLKWLQQHVTASDYGVVLLAGHGYNDPLGEYYFAPANMDLQNLKRTGVVFSAIKNTLINLPGTAVFFVDTCHSGNVLGGRRVDTTGMVNELTSAENGVVVLSASKGSQESLEKADWGNGAFTKAILEGLAGKADYNNSGRITLKMMDLYVSQRVETLTDGKQTPVIIAPYGLADFPIAALR